MNSTLDTNLLASMIKSKRGKKALRETATEIGNISSATLSRVEQGNLPDVETFIRLCTWLGVSTESFIHGKKEEFVELSEKDKLVYQLRSSQELDPETIAAMITMVDFAFTKTRRNG